MFTYKSKKTGKIIKRKTPIAKEKRDDYVLIGWIRNMMLKSQNIIKK